ncbi:HAD family hydrolase [Halobacillus salinarum]|uniref:HAD family hydrolase n=1 Tax=Halobacillus salinarum TaxID=2932257 RepID=A0ABY4EIK0_9BACI|nr:HAD family hydrolase [Halobacillus salinarum]UOQ43454.1 HAD family hydrolase [Halobacillus salinarum]
MIEEAVCLIFDLDGTLYEDTNHFEYYANQLKDRVSKENQSKFEEDYQAALANEHPVTIGKVFDIKYDSILTVDPFTNCVIQAEEWSGREVTEFERKKRYSDEIKYDFESMIAIGDGWWIPFSIAIHYGVSLVSAYQCYVLTKEYMVSEHFRMSKTPRLKDCLKGWKEDKVLILMTNSEEYDVQNILQRLGLRNIFHEIISSAEKPGRTLEHFQNIMGKYRLRPDQVISIGDNFMNEIAPALKLGMKGICIQPVHGLDQYSGLKVVGSLKEITMILSN